MAVITLPHNPVRWRDARFGLLRDDAALEFTNGASQITSYPKALWSIGFDLPPLDGLDKRAWGAALAELAELGNVFMAGPPDYDGPGTGYAGPAPLVSGANQLGVTLNVDGLTASAPVLSRGDFFHVVANGFQELKMATADVTADGAGAATIPFKPALRNPPADNATVEIFAPKTAFGLTTPEARWTSDLNRMRAMSLDAVERFAP